jgi:hypothetical protein
MRRSANAGYRSIQSRLGQGMSGNPECYASNVETRAISRHAREAVIQRADTGNESAGPPLSRGVMEGELSAVTGWVRTTSRTAAGNPSIST